MDHGQKFRLSFVDETGGVIVISIRREHVSSRRLQKKQQASQGNKRPNGETRAVKHPSPFIRFLLGPCIDWHIVSSKRLVRLASERGKAKGLSLNERGRVREKVAGRVSCLGYFTIALHGRVRYQYLRRSLNNNQPT